MLKKNACNRAGENSSWPSFFVIRMFPVCKEHNGQLKPFFPIPEKLLIVFHSWHDLLTSLVFVCFLVFKKERRNFDFFSKSWVCFSIRFSVMCSRQKHPSLDTESNYFNTKLRYGAVRYTYAVQQIYVMCVVCVIFIFQQTQLTSIRCCAYVQQKQDSVLRRILDCNLLDEYLLVCFLRVCGLITEYLSPWQGDVQCVVGWTVWGWGRFFLKSIRYGVCVCRWVFFIFIFIFYDKKLKTLSVHDGWTRLVILSLWDPHLLEGGQRGENGSSNPYGVFSFWWRDNLDLHRGWCEGSELFGHSLSDAGEHSRAARHNDVGVEVSSDVDVALHDGLESAVMDAWRFLADEGWLEEHFGTSESLVANNDHVAICIVQYW